MQQQPCTLTIPRSEAERQLTKRIESGFRILKSTKKSVNLASLKDAFTEWTKQNETYLAQLYSCDEYLKTYKAWYGRISRLRVWSESEEIEVTVNELEYKIDVLENCLEELELIPERDIITPYEMEDYYD